MALRVLAGHVSKTLAVPGVACHHRYMTTATIEGRPWRPRDTLATRFKLLREELGMSQRQFALAVGMPASQVQSIEDGHSPRGLDLKVKRIAAVLGVDREWLMWGGQLADSSEPSGLLADDSMQNSQAHDRLEQPFRPALWLADVA